MNQFCEKLKGDIKFAYKVKKTYDTANKNISLNARNGCQKAAVQLMESMAEQNVVLYHLGFTITDNNRLAKI